MSRRITTTNALDSCTGSVICPVVAEVTWHEGRAIDCRISVGAFNVPARKIDQYLKEQKDLIQKYGVLNHS